MKGNDDDNKDEEDDVTYGAAGVGPLDLGQVLDVGVEDVHLLNQAAQGGLSGLTNLLKDLLRLENREEHNHNTLKHHRLPLGPNFKHCHKLNIFYYTHCV